MHVFAIEKIFSLRSLWLGSISIVSASLALTACGTVDDSVGNTGTVEIFSWWISPGEKEALAASLAIHKQKYPNVTVNNLTDTYGDGARDQLATNFKLGGPPDTFQANIGQALMYWVLTNG